jgi:hypothetical protein
MKKKRIRNNKATNQTGVVDEGKRAAPGARLAA